MVDSRGRDVEREREREKERERKRERDREERGEVMKLQHKAEGFRRNPQGGYVPESRVYNVSSVTLMTVERDSIKRKVSNVTLLLSCLSVSQRKGGGRQEKKKC
jgi:hypothetical protein